MDGAFGSPKFSAPKFGCFRKIVTFRKVYKQLFLLIIIMLRYWINRWKILGMRKHIRRLKYDVEKNQAFNIIGNKCKICRTTKNIRFHEIHGKEHEHSYNYVLNHSKDFVPLCQKCHSILHYVLIAQKMSKPRQNRLIKLIEKRLDLKLDLEKVQFT